MHELNASLGSKAFWISKFLTNIEPWFCFCQFGSGRKDFSADWYFVSHSVVAKFILLCGWQFKGEHLQFLVCWGWKYYQNSAFYNGGGFFSSNYCVVPFLYDVKSLKYFSMVQRDLKMFLNDAKRLTIEVADCFSWLVR